MTSSLSYNLRAKSHPALQNDPKLVQSLVEAYEKNNHVGGQSDPKTAKSLKGLEEWWVCEGEFFINWKGKGYKTVLDLLLVRSNKKSLTCFYKDNNYFQLPYFHLSQNLNIFKTLKQRAASCVRAKG